jgi:hypothetical protein
MLDCDHAAMPRDRDGLEVAVDRFHNGLFFVRLDATLPRDARYPREGQGYFALSPQEARGLARQLSDHADRVAELQAEDG